MDGDKIMDLARKALPRQLRRQYLKKGPLALVALRGLATTSGANQLDNEEVVRGHRVNRTDPQTPPPPSARPLSYSRPRSVRLRSGAARLASARRERPRRGAFGTGYQSVLHRYRGQDRYLRRLVHRQTVWRGHERSELKPRPVEPLDPVAAPCVSCGDEPPRQLSRKPTVLRAGERCPRRERWFDGVVSVNPWFAQPDRSLGTVILLPGRMGGIATPLLHWPASLLTQMGWSVLGVAWDENRLEGEGAASEVRRCADAALTQVPSGQPVLVVAKSLGTLALPWAVENRLPGVWLTPLLQDAAVVAAVEEARQVTLLVGGSNDPCWRPLTAAGPGVMLFELPDADHGLQQPGHWRRSLLHQVEIFDRVSQLGEQILHTTSPDSPPSTPP